MSQDTLKIEIVKKPLIYVPTVNQIVARQEQGSVVLFIDDKRVEMNTVMAHSIGMAIIKSQPAPDELIRVKINNEAVDLLWPIARKVSVALLRKADDADDYQLNNRSKTS